MKHGMFCSCRVFSLAGMILSKQDVIAGSLNCRKEMVCKCNKHILYIQQVVIAYRTQKDTYINPPKAMKGGDHNPS